MTGDVFWGRSSTCADHACVEVAFRDDAVVLVRESRHGRYGPVLRFDHDEWAAFVAGVKLGEFEVPAVD